MSLEQSPLAEHPAIRGARIGVAVGRRQIPLGKELRIILFPERQVRPFATVVILVVVDQGPPTADDLESFVQLDRKRQVGIESEKIKTLIGKPDFLEQTSSDQPKVGIGVTPDVAELVGTALMFQGVEDVAIVLPIMVKGRHAHVSEVGPFDHGDSRFHAFRQRKRVIVEPDHVVTGRRPKSLIEGPDRPFAARFKDHPQIGLFGQPGGRPVGRPAVHDDRFVGMGDILSDSVYTALKPLKAIERWYDNGDNTGCVHRVSPFRGAGAFSLIVYRC